MPIVGKTGKAFLAKSATYAGAKAGIVGYTRGLAREGAPYGINVNCVRPGWIDTDATSRATDEQKTNAIKEMPLGRTGRPEDIAAAVVYLASPASDYMTGMALDVNGNIYGAAGKGETTGLFVLSSAGNLLLHKPMPEFSTNVAFGGPDMRDLYLTASTSVYKMRSLTPGVRLLGPAPSHPESR